MLSQTVIALILMAAVLAVYMLMIRSP